MQINDYIDEAMYRLKSQNYSDFSKEIGITRISLSRIYNGKQLPSEATMIRLAELAGMPKEEALIDLNLWRSKDKPELQKVWQRLAKMIGIILFMLLIPGVSYASETIVTPSDTLYYVYFYSIITLKKLTET